VCVGGEVVSHGQNRMAARPAARRLQGFESVVFDSARGKAATEGDL